MAQYFNSQRASDIIDYVVDFSYWLQEGETVSSQYVNETTNTLTISNISTSNNKVYFLATGGVSGILYSINVQVDTSAGEQKTIQILVEIK